MNQLLGYTERNRQDGAKRALLSLEAVHSKVLAKLMEHRLKFQLDLLAPSRVVGYSAYPQPKCLDLRTHLRIGDEVQNGLERCVFPRYREGVHDHLENMRVRIGSPQGRGNHHSAREVTPLPWGWRPIKYRNGVITLEARQKGNEELAATWKWRSIKSGARMSTGTCDELRLNKQVPTRPVAAWPVNTGLVHFFEQLEVGRQLKLDRVGKL